MIRLPSTALAILLLLATPVAAQQPDRKAKTTPTNAVKIEQAKAFFASGEVAFRLGKFKVALENFLSALRLVKRNSIMLNIAQCYRNLDNPQKSLFYYKLYLSEYARQNVKPIPFHAAVKKHISDMEERLAEKEKDTEQEAQRIANETKEKEQQAKQREAELARLAAEKAKLEAMRKKTVEAENKRLEERQRVANENQERHRTKSTWAYATLAVAIAAGVTASVLYGVGITRRNDAHGRYELAQDATTIAREWSDVESGQNLIYGADAMAALAAITAGISIYQFVTRPEISKESTSQRSTQVAPHLGKTSWGLSLTHTF